MDTSLMHTLNNFFAAHDAVEDSVVAYEQIAQVLFIGILGILFFVVRGHRRATARRAAVASGASVALALAVGQIISHAVNRPRPFVADAGTVHLFAKHVADAGFPSDHATASFAIATAIFLRNKRWGSFVLALAVILSIGRVAMAVHYPSDVLAGAAVGASSAMFFWTPAIRARVDAFADWLARLSDVIERRALTLAHFPRA